jgi:hypothetical protein
MGTSPSPFRRFLHISVTNTHSFIIKTGTFGEAHNDKVSFPLNTLYCEVKPSIVSKGVAFQIQTDFEDITSNLLNTTNIAAFEVGAESGTADLYNFAVDGRELFGRCERVGGIGGGC